MTSTLRVVRHRLRNISDSALYGSVYCTTVFYVRKRKENALNKMIHDIGIQVWNPRFFIQVAKNDRCCFISKIRFSETLVENYITVSEREKHGNEEISRQVGAKRINDVLCLDWNIPCNSSHCLGILQPKTCIRRVSDVGNDINTETSMFFVCFVSYSISVIVVG